MSAIDAFQIADTLRNAVHSGIEEAEIVRRMRSLGLNQLASIKLLRQITGMSLGDAKTAVHSSGVWADRQESNDELHANAEDAATQLGFLETSTYVERNTVNLDNEYELHYWTKALGVSAEELKALVKEYREHGVITPESREVIPPEYRGAVEQLVSGLASSLSGNVTAW